MTETLSGQVESIKVHRESWGVISLLYGSDSERAAVVGHPLGVERGDTIEAQGEWSTHPRFGRQFRASSIRVLAPSDASGAIEWILSRLPGIGRKRATALVERWGIPGLWDVLAERPHELAGAAGGIAGITPERAAAIGAAYRAHIGERDRLVALRGWGLSDRQAARVVAKWGERALETLREDPYQLSLEIDGFGWVRSDEVARAMGLPADHPSRIRAGLEHLLGEARQQGHVYVAAGKLIAMGARLLGVPEEAVVREGRAAIAAGRMVRREAAGKGGSAGGGERVQRIYAPDLDAAEQAVADAVRRMAGSEGPRTRPAPARNDDDGGSFDALARAFDRARSTEAA